MGLPFQIMTHSFRGFDNSEKFFIIET